MISPLAWWTSQPLPVRLGVKTAVTTIMAFLAGICGSVAIHQGRDMSSRSARARQVLIASQSLRTQISEGEAANRHYVLFRRPEYRQHSLQATNDVLPTYNKLFHLGCTNSLQEQRLLELRRLVERRVEILHRTRNEADQDQRAAIDVIRLEGIPSTVGIYSLLDAYDAEEERQLAADQASARRRGNQAQVLLWTVTSIAILASLAGAALHFRTIRSLHEAEEDRDEARGYFKSLLAGLPLGAIVIDTDSRVFHWNPIAERLFGYTEAEALGQPLTELIVPCALHMDHARGVLKYEQNRAGGRIDRPLRVPACHKSGKALEVDLFVVVIRAGSRHQFVGFIRTDWPGTMEATDTGGKDAAAAFDTGFGPNACPPCAGESGGE